jgi:hypothetical protein
VVFRFDSPGFNPTTKQAIYDDSAYIELPELSYVRFHMQLKLDEVKCWVWVRFVEVWKFQESVCNITMRSFMGVRGDWISDERVVLYRTLKRHE